MKSFKFKLEPVLNLRKKKVDEELSKLGLVVGEINRLKNEIDENNQRIQDEFISYDKQIHEGSNLSYIRLFDTYIKGLYNKNEHLENEIDGHQEQLDEARHNVMNAKKDAEVIEIIKNKKIEEFEDMLRRSERYELEEINNALYERNKKGQRNEAKESIRKAHKTSKDKETKSVDKKPKSQYEQLLEYTKPKKKF